MQSSASFTTNLEIAPEWRDSFPANTTASIDAFCAHFGITVSDKSTRSVVQRHTLTTPHGLTRGFYVKLYTYRQRWHQGFFRTSKARREAANLTFFKSLGILTPLVIAVGARKTLFGVCQHYELIVTEEMPGASLLSDYWQTLPRNDPRRRRLIDALAAQTRVLHATNFLHRDLKWRNLLVVPDAHGAPSLCWIDCPNGRFAFIPATARHGKLKDIATLMRFALPLCTKVERLRFVARYLPACPPPERRRFVADLNRYYRIRWEPADERRKMPTASFDLS